MFTYEKYETCSQNEVYGSFFSHIYKLRGTGKRVYLIEIFSQNTVMLASSSYRGGKCEDITVIGLNFCRRKIIEIIGYFDILNSAGHCSYPDYTELQDPWGMFEMLQFANRLVEIFLFTRK